MATAAHATYNAAAGVMLQMPTTAQVVQLYYHEMPSRAAAIAAIVLYGAVTAAVLFTTIKTRAWFMLAGVLTGIMEVVGYGLRLRMMSDPEFYTYVVSYAFLVIAPVFLAVVEYMAVSKLIQRTSAQPQQQGDCSAGKDAAGDAAEAIEPVANIRSNAAFARWVSWFLIISEVVCLGLQCAAGGPLSSKDATRREIGRSMMLIGLLLQLGFFTIFTAITLYVQNSPRFGYRGTLQFCSVFATLYATIGLIYIRNIFRVVEFSQGFDGYLATHEAFFYGFDFAIVFSVLLVFAVLNYGFAFAPAAAPHGAAAEAGMPIAQVVGKDLTPRRRVAGAKSVEAAPKSRLQQMVAAVDADVYRAEHRLQRFAVFKIGGGRP